MKVYENGEFGKIECWYIIDCVFGVELIYGYKVVSKEEFVIWVKNGEWDKLFCKVVIKLGEFYYVLSGIIYVLGMGMLVFEI